MTEIVQPSPPPLERIRFSVAAHAAWAPGRETAAAWLAWAGVAPGAAAITATAAGNNEPALPAMPAMLRRRASPTGKMALQAAYAALEALDLHGADAPDDASLQHDIPTIFCSRHGECGRSVELLSDLARQLPLSPTAFSLSVHNATGGLFSIARRDHGNSLALAAGRSSVEHGAIEACGLLADGAAAVLLIVTDGPLPPMYREFADCDEQAFGWAWLLRAATDPGTGADSDDSDTNVVSLRWSACADDDADDSNTERDLQRTAEPGALQIMRFFLRGDASLQRHAERRRWIWSRDES
jgi:hypothetical protein